MTAFDYVLQVTDQTAGTVTLTTSPFQVKSYQPEAGDREEPSVVETIEVRVADGSPAANLAEVRTLNNLLEQAERAQEGRSVKRVYLTWQENATADVYRSEILRGRVVWESSALELPYWVGNEQFANLHLERRNWWEGPEAQIPLTNPNGTANLTGLSVYNNNCGTGSGTAYEYNYVDIAGTSVFGDLSAPVKMMVTPMVSSMNVIKIANNVTSAGTLIHWFEDISGSSGISGANIAVANRSNGTVFLGTVPNGWTYGGQIHYSIPNLQKDMDGNYARMTLTARAGAITPIKIFASYTAVPGLGPEIYWTPEGTSAYSQVDLGLVKFPHITNGTLPFSLQTLRVVIQHEYGSEFQLWVDSMQVTPIDYYSKYSFKTAAGTADIIYIDPYLDDYYTERGGTALLNDSGSHEGELRIQPQKDQRLYFRFESGGNDTSAVNYVNLKAWYRPRRLTL